MCWLRGEKKLYKISCSKDVTQKVISIKLIGRLRRKAHAFKNIHQRRYFAILNLILSAYHVPSPRSNVWGCFCFLISREIIHVNVEGSVRICKIPAEGKYIFHFPQTGFFTFKMLRTRTKLLWQWRRLSAFRRFQTLRTFLVKFQTI